MLPRRRGPASGAQEGGGRRARNEGAAKTSRGRGERPEVGGADATERGRAGCGGRLAGTCPAGRHRGEGAAMCAGTGGCGVPSWAAPRLSQPSAPSGGSPHKCPLILGVRAALFTRVLLRVRVKVHPRSGVFAPAGCISIARLLIIIGACVRVCACVHPMGDMEKRSHIPGNSFQEISENKAQHRNSLFGS